MLCAEAGRIGDMEDMFVSLAEVCLKGSVEGGLMYRIDDISAFLSVTDLKDASMECWAGLLL